jgi:ferric-dicitrate binding protein FerR (iron transport regulator)
MRRSLSLMSALIASVMILPGEAFCAQQIGVAAAVNNQVEGLSGSAARRLMAGSGVFANERVRTGDASTAQLLFLDKTTVSIGPKAELTLDKFVFDPNRGRGQVVLDVLRGAVRFATGSQNPSNYSIKTAVATIGIRGSIVHISAQPGQTFFGVAEGAAQIKLLNGQVINLLAGWAVIIDKNGNVQGPFKWNITDTAYASTGWTYTGDPANYILPNIGGIDQLNAIDARGFIPPQSTETFGLRRR